MKNKLFSAPLCLIGICLIVSLGFAAAAIAVPQVFNYQGILRNSAGDLQTGTFSMTFKIYDQASGGTAVYNAAGTTTSVVVSNGLYNVQLPATASVFNGSDRYLEVTVGTSTLVPRLKINSVAYSIQTENADYAAVAGTATSAATADTADYATLSGTATNAGTVDNYNTSPSGSPAGGTLYPLDAGGVLSGVPVSAESASGFALFVDGKLGASGAVVGTGTISQTSTEALVTNSAVTANSIIFLTPINNGAIDAKFIKVKTVSNGSFFVSTWDQNATTTADIPFNYLIIN